MRILAIALLCAPLAAGAAPEDDPLARDLLVLTGWFEGEFDNEEQRWFQADPRSGTPEDERDVYWRRVDSTFLVSDDSLHVGMPADRPFELRRVKRFTCGITFDPRGALRCLKTALNRSGRIDRLPGAGNALAYLSPAKDE